jgi:hypothetical protein
MVEYLRGRWPSRKPLPNEIREFMIVKQTGWTLTYVRSLSVRDYLIFNTLSNIYSRLNKDSK